VKTLVVALLAVAALSGCGSDSDSTAKPAAKSASSTPTAPSATPTTEAPVVTLREICPQVESALPGGMIPKYMAMSAFYDTLGTLRDSGDLEAQNALDLLIGPTGDLETEIQYDSRGEPLNSAMSAWLDGISAFADRCKAAGSSALQ
jgi:hypothetical protein